MHLPDMLPEYQTDFPHSGKQVDNRLI
jgi:hypothetical protein